ncbi:MAG: hypothetical protein K5864_03125 [Bacteroidales bacterium]|nr:hypothetical protein [Bacteroidales bacterium]
MKTRQKGVRYLLGVLLATTMMAALSSCETEFSPNGEWQDIPVVYCVLDQDDDTTYVRVQRCFLGEGNMYQFASIADSNYYPAGSIAVRMEKWRLWQDNAGQFHTTGDAPMTVFNFDADQTNHAGGTFPGGMQPIFVCNTGGQLDSGYLYRLIVTKTATGDTLALAETQLITGRMRLIKPNNQTKFNFTGASGNKWCDFTWSTLDNGREYQPVVRFYYRDYVVDHSQSMPDTTITDHSIDIPCNIVKSSMNSASTVLTTRLAQSTFLSALSSNITDTLNKNIVDTVDIYMYCCTEDLAAFMYSNSPTNSINQDRFLYTNIQGGLGVFASRRTHIYFTVNTPNAQNSDYVKSIKALGLGF